MKKYYCVTSAVDDKGRMSASITATKEAEERPQSTETSTSRKDIYNDWFDSLEAAQKWVEEVRTESN